MNSDFSKYPNVQRGHQYALDILSGNIVSGEDIQNACRRYLKDLANTEADFYFDARAAERYLRLAQRFEHVNGNWKTKNVVFEPWQCWVWANIIGFKNKSSNYRRFRTAHLEVARGNGKSAQASIAALYFLALDENINGNQISTVATKKDQARIVLDAARAMARKNKSFLVSKNVQVLAHTIIQPNTNSVVRALSSEHESLDGLQDILAVTDELHAMKRATFEVITSGMSKRKDSLVLSITTAGSNLDSVGYSQSVYAKKVAAGEIDDDTFFAAVYTLDKGDDIFDERVWVKANPNYGVSVDPDTFRAKIKKAKETPADVPGLKIKHLNMWLAEAEAFFDLEKWDACADPTIRIEDFARQSAKGGVDLASHLDLTANAIIFKRDGIYYVFEKTYIPESTVKAAKSTLYDESIARGQLIQTPGEVINYEFIREQILADNQKFLIEGLAYDAWNAGEMAQKLSDKIEMWKFPMNAANFSEPMKRFDAAIREGRIRHNGSPLLRWQIGNVVAKKDHNDNVFPRKNHPRLKIDTAVAILMAFALWLREPETSSVYNERGIRSL